MTSLRYEAWPIPGTPSYDVVVRDLQAVTGSGKLPKTPIGNGSVEIPRGALRVDGTEVLAAVVSTDATTPANDVTSVIRAYRPGDAETAPIHEWLVEDPVAEADETDTVRLSGRNIEAILDYEHVEVHDWDGSTVFQSRFPDHVYGGRNVVRNGGLENQGLINEVYELFNDQTPASTFTLTLEGDTTAAVAFDATPGALETAIEATTGVTNVLVTGTGTEADPWLIECVVPSIIDPDMTVTDAGGLTSTLTRTQQGARSISPFTVSQTLERGVNKVHGRHSSDSPSISTTTPRTGTYSLRFNGLDQFAGVQQVIRVKPGGTYQASMYARTSTATDLYRLVIRTLSEEFIASSTPFSGSTMVANTWTLFTAANVIIPDGVTEIIMRFAYVGTGNPTPVLTDDWALNEGLAAATPGGVLIDLFDDAQTDHAPGRAALTFINLDFTTVVDSDGAAWTDSALSITIKRRQSYFQMMRQFEKLGYEWRLTPTVATPGEWDLQVYNAATMGTDFGGVDDPAIVVGQGTLPSSVTRQRPVANFLMAEGAGGLTARASNAGSITAIGRRAQGVFDRRFTESSPLTTWATQRLTDFLAETLAPRIVIQEPNTSDDWPRPMDEYAPGDIVDFILADGATRVERRIESVSYRDTTQNGLQWTVEGGSAAPFVGASGGGGGGGAGLSNAVSSQLNVLGAAVATILEEFRFDEDQEDFIVSALGGDALPAFTIRVAASAARAQSKAAADFICDGTADEVEIQLALDVCEALGFGRVVLSEGTFLVASGALIIVPGNVMLMGLGRDVTYVESPTLPAEMRINGGELRDMDLTDGVGG